MKNNKECDFDQITSEFLKYSGPSMMILIFSNLFNILLNSIGKMLTYLVTQYLWYYTTAITKVELSINLIYSQSENINIKKESENEQNYYVNLFFVSYWMFSNK